ncbi:MAG: hypothetical protein WBI82_13825 [Sphaerochaeta sp.]
MKTYSDIPLNERRVLSSYDFFLILLFGLISALIFDFMNKTFQLNNDQQIFNWITGFSEETETLSYLSFMILIGIGGILGVFLTWARTHNLFSSILRKVKITETYGREDIFSKFIISNCRGQWITIRDFSNEYIYVGKVHMVSDTFEKREVVLYEVKVYSIAGDPEDRVILFEVDILYLTLEENRFTIEIEDSI